jgi:hypothetical protein
VVNAVSLYVEHRQETFHSVHVEAAERVAVNAAFDQGCRRRRPRSSTAAASAVAPIARAPSSPRTGISLQRNPAPPATSPSCGLKPLHHPGGGCGSVCRSRCAAPDSRPPPAKG